MTSRLAFAILLLPLAVSAPATAAGPLSPRDFAYGIPLEMDGDGALYSFSLPEEVYRRCVSPELDDMRIFNGYGEVVPHLLKPGVRHSEVKREPVTLNFFPLYQQDNGDEGNTQIHIATDSQGTVLDFWQQTPPEKKQVITRYLIDASVLEHPLEKMVLEWDGSAQGFLVPVTLEYSDDLSDWKSLGTSLTLADLNYKGYRLGQHDIELPSLSAKYYRISWPLGARNIQLRSVKAQAPGKVEEVPRQWLRLTPSSKVSKPGIYEFQTAGHFPIDRFRVALPQDNTVVPVKLFSRDKSEDAPWQLRHQGLLYRLSREGRVLQNDTIQFTASNDRFWRLEVGMDGGGLGRGEPGLELGWVPHNVLFVARGETPYSLAFGALDVAAPSSDLASLVRRLKQTQKGNGFIKSAIPGSYFELGGESRLRPEPPPLPWRKWLLWGVLVLGVLLLLLMSRNLYRQMSAADKET